VKTISDFRRAAVPGSRWHCENNLHPHVSGLRVITGGKRVYTYEGTKADGTRFTNGRLELPPAKALRIEGDSIHFLCGADAERVAYTWTLITPGASSTASPTHPTPARAGASSLPRRPSGYRCGLSRVRPGVGAG
jgi:hypothetical protein